jgi:hypothetical protein
VEELLFATPNLIVSLQTIAAAERIGFSSSRTARGVPITPGIAAQRPDRDTSKPDVSRHLAGRTLSTTGPFDPHGRYLQSIDAAGGACFACGPTGSSPAQNTLSLARFMP